MVNRKIAIRLGALFAIHPNIVRNRHISVSFSGVPKLDWHCRSGILGDPSTNFAVGHEVAVDVIPLDKRALISHSLRSNLC